MKKKLVETKIVAPTEGKVKIEGVGTFNVNALKGTRKSDLAEHFQSLPPEQAKAAHDKIWAALKGEEYLDDGSTEPVQ